MGERKDEKAMKLDRKRNRDHGSGKKRCNKTHEMRRKKEEKVHPKETEYYGARNVK